MIGFKQESGITLIALIITIIVLLILAGVLIALIVGDNGVLNNAVEAVEQTGLAGAKEAFEVALAGAEAEYYDAKIKGETNLTSSEYITIAMIRGGLGSSYQYCSADSSAENVADDNKTFAEIYNENGGIIYLSKKGSIGSGTIYKITFDIVDGDVANIIVVIANSETGYDYIIYFDANGEEGEMDPIYATYGEEYILTANTFTYSDGNVYRFKYWSTKADGTGNVYYDQETVNFEENEVKSTLTLYAIWSVGYNISWYCEVEDIRDRNNL